MNMISQELDQVQKAIIAIHRDLFDESPSPMKLQKLCYYAQGYALAEEKELFPENFQAWQHGPVIYDLYYKYKQYKWHPIDEEVSAPDGIDYEYLQDIVSAYGRYDGAALSTMTHRERPWLDARGDLDESEGSNALITKESLRDYFASKLKANG
ncbi:MAG: DUF4065 domain-containing protein [Dolichospermum sp. DEX182a]|nr:DUF4065 domain-containing protein [Dolichospermum sp. DEX182a]